MSSNPKPRRTHRKRVSALRLSSDTTSTLPEYGIWNREDVVDLASDRPPDYPDSAEEADADTDSDSDSGSIYYVPPTPLSAPSLSPSLSPPSPRRQRRPVHRRRHSVSASNDPYLDSLLARSVHALEMSNTLLQSSMSTQTSLSTILTSESSADDVLATSARGLVMRIQGSRGEHARWADDLAEISRGVDGLFDESMTSTSTMGDMSISCSLPSSSPPPQLYRQRRRPSMLELRNEPKPQLHFSYQDRSSLVSPPLRAVTQFVAPDGNALLSPLGPRVPSSSGETSSHSLHASLSSPQLMDRPLEPATPAYNMLSSFVSRAPSSGSSTPSTSITSPIPSFLSTSRRSRNPSTSTERSSRSSSSTTITKKTPPPDTHDRSPRSLTPKQILTALPPPLEEPSSSSSSDSCTAKRTILSLRKILDDAPPVPAPTPAPRPTLLHLRPAAPLAEASTATASVSRLFTKAKHSSSTRPASPPRQSAMKQSSSRSSPAGSPTVTGSPHLLSAGGSGSGSGSGTPSSSGRSTPKRISFAALPESYAGSRPLSSRFKKSRRGKEVGVGNGKGKGRGRGEEEGRDSLEGWWSGWLVGPGGMGIGMGVGAGAGGQGAGAARHEERMEDRLSRGWGGRMTGAFGASGLDDWAM